MDGLTATASVLRFITLAFNYCQWLHECYYLFVISGKRMNDTLSWSLSLCVCNIAKFVCLFNFLLFYSITVSHICFVSVFI